MRRASTRKFSRNRSQRRAFHLCVKKDAADFLPGDLNRWSDYANYLQHRIVVGRMYWEKKEGGYVTLHRGTLKRAVHHTILGPIMNWMLENKVIERDGSRDQWTGFKPARGRDGSDGVSIGYRFCDTYAALPNKRVACRSVKANNKFLRLQKRPEQFRN